MMRVQCYERKPRVWIGTGEDGLPVDIVIPGLLTSLLLRKDSFLLKREAGGECRRSEEHTSELQSLSC